MNYNNCWRLITLISNYDIQNTFKTHNQFTTFKHINSHSPHSITFNHIHPH